MLKTFGLRRNRCKNLTIIHNLHNYVFDEMYILFTSSQNIKFLIKEQYCQLDCLTSEAAHEFRYK